MLEAYLVLAIFALIGAIVTLPTMIERAKEDAQKNNKLN